VFVHQSAVQATGSRLHGGERVTYKLVKSERGIQAFDVAVASGSLFDRSRKRFAASGGTDPLATSSTGVRSPLALRQVLYGKLSREAVMGLRRRRIDVETAMFGDAAVDDSLRDPRLLVDVFDAFAACGGDAALANVAKKWGDPTWTVSTQSSVSVQSTFEGMEWISHVELELTVNPRNGRRFANIMLRLATDGCLLLSEADMQRRGEISTVLQSLHHGRPFFEMTDLGASVFRTIRDSMLQLLGASVGEVEFIAMYCGYVDRMDLKCIDRRLPLLVRTVQVSFEPGRPAG